MNAKQKAYEYYKLSYSNIKMTTAKEVFKQADNNFKKAVDIAIQEAKKEVFDDLDNLDESMCIAPQIEDIKKRHLSTFVKNKSNIIADKSKSAKIYIGGVGG